MGWAVARRLVSSPRVAGLAGLVYALSFTHVVPWSWLAHRNGLVSSFFALACILAHIHWRAEGKRWAAVAAPMLLAGAVAAPFGLEGPFLSAAGAGIDWILAVARIAGTCGFSTTEAFCRAFRERHGVTPLEYRRKATEGTRQERSL